MARPRLGIGFEGTLYLGRLGLTQLPELGRMPPAPIVEQLIAAAGRYELVIYPLRPCPRAALRAWLLFQLERHFEGQRYDRPQKLALTLVDQIDFADDRSQLRVDLAIDIGGFPRAEDLDRIGALFETITQATLPICA
jgi:hypothetical protein